MEIQTNTRNDRTFTLCSSISTEGCFLDVHLSARLYTCQGIISGLILTLTLKERGDWKKTVDFTVILKSGRSLRHPNNMDYNSFFSAGSFFMFSPLLFQRITSCYCSLINTSGCFVASDISCGT